MKRVVSAAFAMSSAATVLAGSLLLAGVFVRDVAAESVPAMEVIHATATSGPSGNVGLALSVGLAPDDGQPETCGTASTLAVRVGDAINFCYTVTNTSATTLSYHSLSDSTDGPIFSLMHHDVAPGMSFQFNRIVTARSDASTYAASWTAQDFAPGYAAQPITPAFVDISGSGTSLTLADDSATGITLPFAFTLYDSTSDLLSVGNNGTLVLGTLDGSSYAFNDPIPYLPDIFMGGPLILPFWDDLVETTGGVWWQVTGSPPNRMAIVQWRRLHFQQTGGAPVDFEVLLGEDGSLAFQYGNTAFGDPANADWDHAGSATIALQNIDASIGNQYSYNAPSLASPDAIAWVVTDPVVFEAGATVTLDVSPALVAATMTVTPDPLTIGAAPGASPVSVPVVIANSGDLELHWSVTEAAGRAAPPGIARPPVSPAPSNLLKRKRAANDGTRNRFRSHVADFVAIRATDDPDCGSDVPGMVIHDDGAPDDGYTDGSGLFSVVSYVDRFTPASYPATLGSACVSFLTSATEPTSQDFQVVVYDDTGFDGTPGNQLAAVAATATNIPNTAVASFVKVDLGDRGISIPSGSFYIGVAFDPNQPGGVYVASDTSGTPNAANGYHMRGSPESPGGWDPTIDQFPDYHSLLVRATLQPDHCASSEDQPWLTLSVNGGVVGPHDAATITATIDPTGLAEGDHPATLCFASNDPAHPRIVVPVLVHIGDAIFADGFEP